MPVTCCVGPFSVRLFKIALTRKAWDAEINKQPEDCIIPGCSPGGCRKHCQEYASGRWVQMNAAKPKRKKA